MNKFRNRINNSPTLQMIIILILGVFFAIFFRLILADVKNDYASKQNQQNVINIEENK